MPSALTIVHHPAGIDHPYEPLFEERRPRDPSGGDMVALGFLTQPGRVIETVRVDWTRNGRPQTPIFARPVQRGTDEDRWLVELGVVEGGDEVVYCLSATADDGAQAESSEFSFTTRRWRRAVRFAEVDLDKGVRRLATIASDGAPGPDLLVDASRADVTRISVTPASIPKEPEDPRDPFSLEIARCQRDPLSFTLRWQDEGTRTVAIELSAPLGD